MKPAPSYCTREETKIDRLLISFTQNHHLVEFCVTMCPVKPGSQADDPHPNLKPGCLSAVASLFFFFEPFQYFTKTSFKSTDDSEQIEAVPQTSAARLTAEGAEKGPELLNVASFGGVNNQFLINRYSDICLLNIFHWASKYKRVDKRSYADFSLLFAVKTEAGDKM